MDKYTSKQSFQKKALLIAFLILCSLVMSENVFSRKYWDRVLINFDSKESKIKLLFYFIYYDYKPLGVHAYLEWCDIKFSFDGLHYEKLLRCEVEDQLRHDTASITMKDKFPGARVIFSYCYNPSSGTEWAENMNVKIRAWTTINKGYTMITWFIPANRKIHDILIVGKWHVNGLNCSEDLFAKRYVVKYTNRLDSELNTETNLKYVNDQETNQYERNVAKVCIETDAILLKGVGRSENIRFYATSGTLLR